MPTGTGGSVVQAVDTGLHVLEADVGVHVGRGRRVSVAELLLDLAQVAGLPQQVDRQRVPGGVDAEFAGQAGAFAADEWRLLPADPCARNTTKAPPRSRRETG